MLNNVEKSHPQVKIEPVKWETDLPSGSVKEPRIQAAINLELERCDMVLVLVYALKGIKDYRAHRLNLSLEISDIRSKQEGSAGENGEKEREYQEWLDTHPDPVKTLAEQCLDKILEKVGLKVKVDIDLPSIRNPGYIQLQAPDGTVVPGEFWSTGTRHIVMTILPLFQVKPRNAVILIYEPEHSLYPDIQLEIVDLYTKKTRECQFFFTTHSPVIASVFDPWEIVEFKFDRESRKVTINRFHEGENDVANYRYYPQYLRWDLILQDIFKMEEEGGEKRIDALNKFAELNVRIRKLKMNNQLDTPGGQNLIEEARAIGEKSTNPSFSLPNTANGWRN